MTRSRPAPTSHSQLGGVAFFDLDRTLLGCNSAFPWLLEELRSGHLRLGGAARALGWLLCYSLGYSNLESVLERSIATLAGRSARDNEAHISEWYARVLRRRIRPGGRAAIGAHRANGERCVLLTSATQHLSDLIARDLALDGVICTQLEIDREDVYTGRVVGRPCFGEGKAAAAAAWAAAACVPLSACTFYTDSASDLPVLDLVGHPVAVHPDPRLRRVAAARGWPIVDWKA